MLHIQPEHVVLLSDRGPVRFTSRSGQLVLERQSSSVTALLHGVAGVIASPVTWVTPSTSAADAKAMRLGLFRDLTSRLGYSPDVVLIHEQEYERYYYDAGVRIIWSAWHGIEDDIPIQCDGENPLASLASYVRVNRRLSSRIAQVAVKGAIVAVQDYQFMLAPTIIRGLRPDARIVHFSHTPFPDSESVAKLPSAVVRTLVTGMLGQTCSVSNLPDGHIVSCNVASGLVWMLIKTMVRCGMAVAKSGCGVTRCLSTSCP